MERTVSVLYVAWLKCRLCVVPLWRPLAEGDVEHGDPRSRRERHRGGVTLDVDGDGLVRLVFSGGGCVSSSTLRRAPGWRVRMGKAQVQGRH